MTLSVENSSRSLYLSYPRALYGWSLSSNTIRGEKIYSGQIKSDPFPGESLKNSHVLIKYDVLRLNDAVRSDTITNSYDWKLLVLIVEIFLKVRNCSTINTITTTYLKIRWDLMRLLRMEKMTNNMNNSWRVGKVFDIILLHFGRLDRIEIMNKLEKCISFVKNKFISDGHSKRWFVIVPVISWISSVKNYFGNKYILKYRKKIVCLHLTCVSRYVIFNFFLFLLAFISVVIQLNTETTWILSKRTEQNTMEYCWKIYY